MLIQIKSLKENKQVRLNPITTNGVVTYETVVSVDNSELLLKPGMTANAKIITKNIKDQVLIPNSALRFTPKIVLKKQLQNQLVLEHHQILELKEVLQR